jgi:hypothetical protein
MDIKTFLLESNEINLTAIAAAMWPKNKESRSYLSKKLNGLDERSFTQKDEKKALEVLQDLAKRINNLQISQ